MKAKSEPRLMERVYLFHIIGYLVCFFGVTWGFDPKTVIGASVVAGLFAAAIPKG